LKARHWQAGSACPLFFFFEDSTLAGWFGLPVLLFFSMLTCYTAKLLGKILEHVPSKKLRDGAGAYTIYGFHDMGELVFGEYGKIFISVIFVLETFGYCCVYLIIEGENLEHQLRYHAWFEGWGKAEFMSMSALIFLPSCLLRNLSWLSYFSALGVFSSMCLLMGVLATGLLPDTPPAPGLSHSRPLPESEEICNDTTLPYSPPAHQMSVVACAIGFRVVDCEWLLVDWLLVDWLRVDWLLVDCEWLLVRFDELSPFLNGVCVCVYLCICVPEFCARPACTGSLYEPSVTDRVHMGHTLEMLGLMMVGFAGHAVFPTLRCLYPTLNPKP